MFNLAMSGVDNCLPRNAPTTAPWEASKAPEGRFTEKDKLGHASPRVTAAMELLSMVISWSQLRTLRHSRALEAREAVRSLRARGRPVLGRRNIVVGRETALDMDAFSPSSSTSTSDRSTDSPSSVNVGVWDAGGAENAGFVTEKSDRRLPCVSFAPEVVAFPRQTTRDGAASDAELFAFPPSVLQEMSPQAESDRTFPPRRWKDAIPADFTLCKLVPVPGTVEWGQVVEARLLRIVPATAEHRQAVLELGAEDGSMSDLDFLPDQYLHLCQDSSTAVCFVGEVDGQVVAYSCTEVVDGQGTAFRLCGRVAGGREFWHQAYAHFLLETLGELRERVPALCRDAFLTSLDHCLAHQLHRGFHVVLVRKAVSYRLTPEVTLDDFGHGYDNVVELTETDLCLLFSQKALLPRQIKLFPVGRVVVGWQAYRVEPSNVAAIFRQDLLALGSAGRSPSGQDLTLVSFGCWWPCKAGLCYVIHLYGDVDAASLVHAHLWWHCHCAARHAPACGAAAVEMQVFVNESDPSHCVAQVMEDNLKLAKGKSVPPMVLLEMPIRQRSG